MTKKSKSLKKKRKDRINKSANRSRKRTTNNR